MQAGGHRFEPGILHHVAEGGVLVRWEQPEIGCPVVRKDDGHALARTPSRRNGGELFDN